MARDARLQFAAFPDREASVRVRSCMRVIPGAELEKRLRFRVDGPGLVMAGASARVAER